MDGATTNGIFALAGVALGSLPALGGQWFDRRSARDDKKAERTRAEREQMVATFSGFLEAADQVIATSRSHVNLGPRTRVVIVGADDRKLFPDEVNNLAMARQAASKAVLLARRKETRAAIDAMVALLTEVLTQPDATYHLIEAARLNVVDALRHEINPDG